MTILKNSTGRDGEWSYPLYDRHDLCPNHEYTGALSVYVCRCQQPTQCPGVLKVAEVYGNPGKLLYKVFRGELQEENVTRDRDYRAFTDQGWVDSVAQAWQRWTQQGE
jgi:hypothetical protein